MPPAPRPQTLLEAIWSSLIWGVLDRATGLIKHIFIATTVGLSAELDVFYMANALLTLFVNSWSRIADVIAVPRLVALQKNDPQKVRQLCGDLFSLSLLFSAGLGMLLNLGWDSLAELIWGGDPARRALLSAALYWSEPLVLLTIPVSMLYSFAKARKAFYLRYRNDFLTSLTILSAVALWPDAPGVLLWSYSLGLMLSFTVALFESRRDLVFWGNPISPAIRQLLPLAPALLVLYGVDYLYALINRQFVAALPPGTVSAVAYALTLAKLLPSLLRVDGAFMTFYAETKDQPKQRDDRVNSLLSTGIVVGVGLTLIVQLFAEDFVRLALEHGKFHRDNTLMVSRCTRLFGFAMIPFLLMPALGQICQVENRLKLLMRRTLLGLVLNISCAALLIFVYDFGAAGVAVSTSLSQWGMFLLSLVLVERLGLVIQFSRHAGWLLTTLIYGLAAAALGQILGTLVPGLGGLILEAVSFLGGYSLLVLLGRDPDSGVARILFRRAMEKLRSRRPRSLSKTL